MEDNLKIKDILDSYYVHLIVNHNDKYETIMINSNKYCADN